MKKIIRLTELQFTTVIKRILNECQLSIDEFDFNRFKNDDDMQKLRDTIDKNITVSVAFVKKDNTVRFMSVRKYLKSYKPSDKPKSELQKNFQENNDIKRVIDINLYIKTLKELKNRNFDEDEAKELAAKSAWRNINLKNVLGFMVRGEFIDLRSENQIRERFGEEIYNNLTKSMKNSLGQEHNNIIQQLEEYGR